MILWYMLDDDKNVVPVPDQKDYRFIEDHVLDPERKRVALDQVGEYRVSTVFLGLDHSFFGEGPPVVFETMIFADKKDIASDVYCKRYCTWNEAVVGHKEAIEWAYKERREDREER